MKPITQEKDKLGFVGIGFMGRPIARRLVESGLKLTAYDRDRSKAAGVIQSCCSYTQCLDCVSLRGVQNTWKYSFPR